MHTEDQEVEKGNQEITEDQEVEKGNQEITEDQEVEKGNQEITDLLPSPDTAQNHPAMNQGAIRNIGNNFISLIIIL